MCACCRVVDDRYKLEKCIHIAMLYLQVRQASDAGRQGMLTSKSGALLLKLMLPSSPHCDPNPVSRAACLCTTG